MMLSVDFKMLSVAVRTAQQKLMASGLGFEGSFEGCTEEEIRVVEEHFAIQLPASYRDFLSVMGHKAGYFLQGSDYTYPKMLGFRKAADKVLRRCNPDYRMSATLFVFISHQDYSFLWFDCNDPTGDPPVFLFTEQEKEPRKVSDSFSAWLLFAVEDDIASYQKLAGG
jgi:hypothetical protein